MAYSGSIDLISGIRPKNNGTFPLVDAKDVYVNDEFRLDTYLAQLGGGGVIDIEWATLNTKKSQDELEPGQQYRITDYVATVANDNTAQSANHQFDLIVVADDVNKLSEIARAVKHSGDTYFPSATKFEAWKVWYCFDNDTSRFAWADTTNGKGVIYRLIDEFNNDVPYDFKGIQFLAYGDTDNVYRYTFDSGSASDNVDNSLTGWSKSIYNNHISPCKATTSGIRLNQIVFKGQLCYNNYFGLGCRTSTFGLQGCNDNSFGNECHSNILKGECDYNIFGDGCVSNTLNQGCSDNIFGNYCSTNTFGQICALNELHESCEHNTFGSSCVNNVLGNGSTYNNIGNECEQNTLGSICTHNVLGTKCRFNAFGNGCKHNVFGDTCNHNTFGNYCMYVIFGTADTTRSKYRNIIIQSSVEYVYLNCTATLPSGKFYQNVEVSLGVNGTSSTPKQINDANYNQTFKTTYKPANSEVIEV